MNRRPITHDRSAGPMPAMALWLALCILAGCGSAPPANPTGHIPEDVRDVTDPVPAITQRLAAAGPMLDAADSGTGTSKELQALAREIAALVSHGKFSPWPVTQSRVRTRILFLIDDDGAIRRAALDECRKLFAALRKNAAARGGRP